MPDSKLTKRIKKAELALKRAESRKADPETIWEHKNLLEELYLQRTINKELHGG